MGQTRESSGEGEMRTFEEIINRELF